jgi:hypothetical protein
MTIALSNVFDWRGAAATVVFTGSRIRHGNVALRTT